MVEPLYALSVRAKKTYEDVFLKIDPSKFETICKLEELKDVPFPKFTVICGDFLLTDWSHADLVYVTCTMFGKELMEAIATKMKELKKGTWLISVS